jgi:hypothetical protein
MIIYNQHRRDYEAEKNPQRRSREGTVGVKLSEEREITFEGQKERKESFIPPKVNCCSFSPMEIA